VFDFVYYVGSLLIHWLFQVGAKNSENEESVCNFKGSRVVVEALTREVAPEDADNLIPEELKKVMESDAAMNEGEVAYNIVPLDAPVVANAITSFP